MKNITGQLRNQPTHSAWLQIISQSRYEFRSRAFSQIHMRIQEPINIRDQIKIQIKEEIKST